MDEVIIDNIVIYNLLFLKSIFLSDSLYHTYINEETNIRLGRKCLIIIWYIYYTSFLYLSDNKSIVSPLSNVIILSVLSTIIFLVSFM